MNLCPFARREVVRGSVRYAVTDVAKTTTLLAEVQQELERLLAEPEIETTLLIHPNALSDFFDYNDFLGVCEALIADMALEGVIQIASFHPAYQFAGTEPGDAENFTNRSPYPMLHLLREDSISRAVDSHPDIDAVPERNIALLNRTGAVELERIWQDCLE